MKFSYNWLQSFFERKLPQPEELAELLTMHSFEVEEVVRQGEDWILDIDVLPNRAHDCLSHLGVAREISVLTNSKLRRQKSPPKADPPLAEKPQLKSQNLTNALVVTIEGKNLCPRYSAYVIDDVKITESPAWIKGRLAAMGQKPINNVVDVTNYILWELGQPLHAFDFAKIRGARMNIRVSAHGEKLETLDGATHDLGSSSIIIEDAERIIDLAGIKGGANTEIDDNTTRIIFQAAIFDPAHIRHTSETLGVKTDASVRYMHGFDQGLPPQALSRAIELLWETSPQAKIAQKIDIYPDPIKPKKIVVDTQYVNTFLGTDISKKKIEQMLQALGFALPSLRRTFKMKDLGFKFTVTVPSHRLDVDIAEDVIEEIGRVYGCENIKDSSPRGILISPRRNERVFWRSKARDILSGFGFFEVCNYSMIGKQSSPFVPSSLEIANPISDEFRYLRPALWPGILKNIASNSRYFDSVRVFEIGKVFGQESGGIFEKENCIFALTSPHNEDGKESFYSIKGYLDEFLKEFGITDFYLDSALEKEEEGCLNFLHAGRRAQIALDGKKIGFIGEIHPATRRSFNVDVRVFCAEFDFEKVSTAAEEEHIYEKPSLYPEVVRDIALLVPKGTAVVEVENVINAVSGPLLRDVDLFDMYEGENMPEGMKNFAFHLLFQSFERTLTSQEVDKVMSQITKALEEKLWEVR